MTAIARFLALLAFAVGSLAGTGAACAGDASLKIEARLFGSKTGRLSDDVLADPGRLLGNVIIGDDPSSATFVTVLIRSERPLPANAKLRLLATELRSKSAPNGSGKPIRRVLDSAVRVPPTGDWAGVVHVGFWLSETGCSPIALKAELSAPPARKVSAAATLDFACYE